MAPHPFALFISCADICSICLDSLDVGERGLLRCGHEFHKECVERWLSAKETGQKVCPECRAPVVHVSTSNNSSSDARAANERERIARENSTVIEGEISRAASSP